jgi:hypothetical protein
VANNKKQTCWIHAENIEGRSLILESYYRYYSKTYFKSKMPETRIYWYKFRKQCTHGITAWSGGSLDAVYVSADLKNQACYALQTLLHEMIHVAKPDANHGPVFLKERKRLYKAGAYINLV